MDAGNVARFRRATKRSTQKKYDFLAAAFAATVRILTTLAVTSPAALTGAVETPKNWAKQQAPQLTQIYTELHQAPELSFHEEKTSERMAAELRELGLAVTEHVGGFGVVGILENGPGKTLLLRADMDALPVAEETGLPYASAVRVRDDRGATVGVMHACGHDMHMTNLIGAVRFLAEHRDLWKGTVVAVFQPAEERGAGAKAMLEAGLLKRFPRPDFAFALHVAAGEPAGTVGYRAGYAMANVDSVDITVRGRGGHGAYPHATVDPVVIASRLVLDLQTIVSREIDPVEPAVITVGSIHGGTKHNIIGETCDLQLTVRSYSPKVRKQLIEAIQRKAMASAASANAPEPEISVSEGTPALFNDYKLTDRVVSALQRVLEKENVKEVQPTMGGEDFGRIGRAGVPIVMLRLGAVAPERLEDYKEQGVPPPSLHSPKFYPDLQKTIVTGVTTLATVALELLEPGQE